MGITYKRHFPSAWSEEELLICISTIVNDSHFLHKQITAKSGMWLARPAKFIVEGVWRGIRIRIVIEPEDRGVLTAYPIYKGLLSQ